MPPARTGTVTPHTVGGVLHYDVRIRLADGSKSRRECLDPSVSHEQAQAEALELQRIEDARNKPAQTRLGAPLTGPTCDGWIQPWFQDRERRGLSSVSDDRGRWNKWVSPWIGHRQMSGPGRVEKADLEDVVEKLDNAVIAGALGWKTAVNAWVVVSKVFKDASSAKTRALRVREDNPALGVAPPDKGGTLALQYLTPAEFLQLVGCADVALACRRAAVLATFLLVRASELVPLMWDAVDLAAGNVLVHTALNKKRQRKTTKMKRARRVPIEPALLPLLVAMHREAGGVGRVVPIGAGQHLARGLRRWLVAAKVLRPELHTSDATRRAVRFHDLRATGITWHAIAGLPAEKIMSRSGHEDYKSMKGYLREAEVLSASGTFGKVFPPLPLEALGVRVEPQPLRIGTATPAQAQAEEEADQAPRPVPVVWTRIGPGLDQRPNDRLSKPADRGAGDGIRTREEPNDSRHLETNDAASERPTSPIVADQPGPSEGSARDAAVARLAELVAALAAAGDREGARAVAATMTALLGA